LHQQTSEIATCWWFLGLHAVISQVGMQKLFSDRIKFQLTAFETQVAVAWRSEVARKATLTRLHVVGYLIWSMTDGIDGNITEEWHSENVSRGSEM
jgi:hypothetical protein